MKEIGGYWDWEGPDWRREEERDHRGDEGKRGKDGNSANRRNVNQGAGAQSGEGKDIIVSLTMAKNTSTIVTLSLIHLDTNNVVTVSIPIGRK